MGHDHAHHSHHRSERRLRWALTITFTYMIVEVIGGLWTGSLALLADAGHMLSDAGALSVAVLAARLARRPPDARCTMGYQRAEVLGAAINAGALVVLSAWIAVEGIERLSAPAEIQAGPMMLVAGIGLAINLGLAGMLAQGEADLNMRAALWHVLGDALGSIGALLAGGLIMWKGLSWADPVASLVIAIILAVGGVRVLREVGRVLMHSAPVGVDVVRLEEEIAQVVGVRSIHDLHLWILRPGENVVTVHVVLADGADATDVCQNVRRKLLESLPHANVTVQSEPADSECQPRKQSGSAH